MISSKVLIPLVVGVACLLAVLAGTNLAVDANQTMVFSGLIAMIGVLLLFAREFWWLGLFVAVGFGGYLYFGFKIYSHECLLALALGGLLPSIAINPTSEFGRGRPLLPWFFYATLIYLGLEIPYSVAINDPHGMIEIGNIVRAYTFGIWPLVFVFFFRLYGRTSYLPFALYLLQSIYIFRALLTIGTIYFPKATMVLPAINFVLPGNDANGGGLDDLRFSGHGMCLLACAILLGHPKPSVRFWQCIVFAFSLLCLLMGGGRGLTVASMLVIIAAIAAARMWKALTAATFAVICLIVFLNLFPRSLDVVDYRVQRTLSVLIWNGDSSETKMRVAGSDVWHDRLREIGFERWITSPRTFVFGTGIRPWNASAVRETNWALKFEALLQGAADTGGYESALWTILAPAGLAGLLLCVCTIGYFALYNGRRLLSGQLSGMERTVAFLGVYAPIEWALFSPVQGGYPAIELLYAATAFYYLHDHCLSGSSQISNHQAEDDSPYAETARS